MNLDFDSMLAMQAALQEKYKGQWEEIGPECGKNKLLWMLIEAAEMADIIKKEGEQCVMDKPETRAHFVEEMCDTLMYFTDIMLCFNITAEELGSIYAKKHDYNMKRW